MADELIGRLQSFVDNMEPGIGAHPVSALMKTYRPVDGLSYWDQFCADLRAILDLAKDYNDTLTRVHKAEARVELLEEDRKALAQERNEAVARARIAEEAFAAAGDMAMENAADYDELVRNAEAQVAALKAEIERRNANS